MHYWAQGQSWAFQSDMSGTCWSLQGHHWGCPCTVHILDCHALSPIPMLFAALECGESMPERGLLFGGEILLNLIRILICKLVHVHAVKTNLLTPRILHASTTQVQSWSTIFKADHGMCFMSWLLHCKVVIGPYISSADVMNNAIGCH